ncbi:MAG: phage tail tape measure protein [Bacteroidetes bacterium]|nr:phage tail tape measure protein [Bacteroidota bacterium]
MDYNEEGKLTLKVDAAQMNEELLSLNKQAKELRDSLKQIESVGGKGSDNWKDYKLQLEEVRKKQAELNAEMKKMDLADMTLGQLENHVKSLNKELKGLVPGTQAFIDATERLQDANKHLGAARDQVKGIKTEAENLAQPTLWDKVSGGVGKMVNAFNAFIALAVFQFIVSGFRAIIGAFTSFEDAAQDLSALTGLTGKELEYLKDQAKATGPQFGMTAAEMLNAYKVMGGAKPELLAQKEALADVTKEAIILAKAGKLDLADSAKSVAESLNQFGAKADQARRFINVMAAGAKEGSAEINEMSSSLKASGTVAASAKLSFEQTNAILQSLSTIALKGEQSGTQLKNVLIKLMSGADDTNPKIVGLDKALENLGKQNLSTAEMAKKFGTENVVAAQHIITHGKEITELTAKMTGTNTAYDQARINMDTLSERWKQGTAIVTGFAVSIGEKLAPYVKKAIDFFLEWASNVGVYTGVFSTFGGVLGDIWDVISTLGTLILGKFIPSGTSMRDVMQGVAVVLQTVASVVRVFTASLVALLEAFQAVGSGAKGLVLFLTGDFAGAGKAFDETRQHGVKIKETFTKAFQDISEGYKTAMADKPKEIMPAAVKAHQDTAKGVEDAITDEAKKGHDNRSKEQIKADEKAKKDKEKQLEDYRKAEDDYLQKVKAANAKAIEEVAALDAEANISSIRDELQREIAKIEEKKRKRLEDINASLAEEQYKNRLREAAEKAATEAIQKVQEEHRQKRLKAEEEAEKQRLEAANFIRTQEKKAEEAILDWRELSAKGNAKLLTQVAKDRVDNELRFKKEQYEQQEAADKAKATREIKDSDQLEAALLAIEKRYHGESVLAEADAAEKKKKIDADLKKQKEENLKGYSDMFSNLLKGNVVAFAEGVQKMVKGHKEGWQQKIEEDMGKYEMVADMAQTAVNFLNDLAQKRAEREIALAQKERDEKVAALQQQLDQNARDQEMAAMKEEALKTELSNDLQNLKDAETRRLEELERILTDTTTSEEQKKAAMREELSQEYQILITNEKAKVEALTIENTNKVKALETQKETALKLLNEEMNAAKTETERRAVAAKIEAAEKEMNAKIKAATEEKEKSIKMAEEAKEAKIKAAAEERDKKLKDLETLNLNEKKNTDELLKVAKTASTTRISDAEKERDRKLTVSANEKENLIKNQKDLQNAITAENDKARATEVAAKRKAWKAQQNADIASAIIAGALATIKALASGFFPVNLVFAAATAVATGIQVAMIKRQPEPTFALGGIPQGPRHGRRYGESGLAIVDRRTGREAGEMEGGEAIISREQTEANMPLIQQMFRNARNPGRRKDPVLRAPIALRDGGLLNIPKTRMFEYGGRAEYEDSENRNDAAEGASISNENDSSISSSSDGGSGINEAEARAASEEAKKQGEMQLKLLKEIADNVKSVEKMTNDAGMATVMKLAEVKNATDNVAQKVQGVEGAIWGTNQSGRLDQLISSISNFGKG